MVIAGGASPMMELPRFDNEHPSLQHCFHPVCRSSDVAEGALVPVTLCGQRWVIARIDGQVVAMIDRCPHRSSPLSAGCIVDGSVQCAYHGYRFGPDGQCTGIPALGVSAALPPKARV